MKVYVENLGVIRYAELEIADLTIICGKNNSGKTYITYAIYGFIDYWKNKFTISVDNEFILKLKQSGIVKIPLVEYVQNAQKIISQACDKYSHNLAYVFSAPEKLFENSKIDIKIKDDEVTVVESEFNGGIKTSNTKAEVLTLHKAQCELELTATLFAENTDGEIPDFIIADTISDAVKELVFQNLFTACFIASAERTGVAIFRAELNLARNRILDKFIKKDVDINPIELLRKESLDYPLPVEHNVEFTRKLEQLSKTESYISKEHKYILDNFSDILGGEYQVTKNNEIYFIPTKKSIKLTMDQSSSAVRSMLDIGFYLKHVANKGDMLIIDEPELNLHPENQRKVARLFASLINCGLRVFVTTHSDYILRELSNLILLNSDKPYILNIVEKEGYAKTELLAASNIKVYVAEQARVKLKSGTRSSKASTLTLTKVDNETGIQTSCFDDTIETMNRIQDEIIFGE